MLKNNHNQPFEIKKCRIIVAGCGDMGLPMARNLARDGFDVGGFDIRPADEFGSWQTHMQPVSALQECDLLISVVRDEQETGSLCFGEQGVFNGERYPGCLVVCSTLRPGYIGTLKQSLPTDVILVDAPMSGASHAAIDGTLTFMLGGDSKVIENLEPMFGAMGARHFRVGELGTGMTYKVLNNYVTATSVVAVRRIRDSAESLGISPDSLREVMAVSSGATWFGDNYDKIYWAGEPYSADNTMGILEKDVGCALDVLSGDETDRLFDNALLDALRSLVDKT